MAKHRSAEVVYYTSNLLDRYKIRHGFFTRQGGVSPPPFDSLNVKRGIGDNYENVTRNRQKVCETIAVDGRRLVFANDLGHANRVMVVDESYAGSDQPGLDGLITRTNNLPIALSVADCVPILLAAQRQPIAVVLHVSWRSLVAGVIDEAFKQIDEAGDNLLAALGPAIGPNSYEVGQELITAVSPRYDQFLSKHDNKTHFDLPAAAAQALKQVGIQQIDKLDIDTFTHKDEFYSYRRDKRTGRFAAIVSL